MLGADLLDRSGYWADCVAALLPKTPGEGAHAVAVYFHGILADPEDGLVDPQERITSGFLQDFIRVMKAAGYRFVTPDALFTADPLGPNLAVLSSDDGYASVEGVLPMLEAEGVPLTVFLSSEYCRTGTLYWWDQLYIAGRSRPGTRGLLKHGVRSREERDAALRGLGLDPAAPAFSESHRLLSPPEVNRLASHPMLCFGNHTRNHLSLPLLCESRVVDEIEGARREIEAWTGREVRHVALPYGDCDERTLGLLERCGCRTVFTTEPGPLPLWVHHDPRQIRVVPRYRLRGDRSARWQARIMGHGVVFGAKVRDTIARWVSSRREARRRRGHG